MALPFQNVAAIGPHHVVAASVITVMVNITSILVIFISCSLSTLKRGRCLIGFRQEDSKLQVMMKHARKL